MGHWLHVPFLCRQLGLRSYSGCRWRGSVIRGQQQGILASCGRLAVGSDGGDQRLECVCMLENNCKSLLKLGLARQPGCWLYLATYFHRRGEYVALWAPPAMLLSVLLCHDSAPVQVVLVDSGKLLEGKGLILSKQTETGLCFSLQDKADLVACNWRVHTNERKKAF